MVAVVRRLPADLRAVLLVALGVALLCQVPVLVNPSFYFWDDSAAQFLPMWHRLGERLLAGDWPLMLDVDAWMGGDLAGEALFGIWNPVHLADFAAVALCDDLAVAAALVKTQFLCVLGTGVFAVCRAHGVRRSVASVFAVALPVSGFVLYFEAMSWAAGLMGLAWLPWLWWSLRRLRLGGGVLPPFAFAYLCVSAGDPYGVLAAGFLFVGMAVESFFAGTGVRRVLLVGVASAATLPLVFLPLVTTAPVTWRSGFELFNTGQLVPGLLDLATASVPSFVPRIQSFGLFRMTVPAVYLAWFAVPLAPWMDWSVLRSEWRRCTSVLLVGGVYLLLCLGPSNVGLFRWPLRHIAVLYLAVSLLLAIVLSRGVRTDHLRARVLCTAGILALCGYFACVGWPAQSPKHLVSVALITGLLVVSLVWRRHFAAVLHAGTAIALVLQVLWFPENRDVAVYNFPTSVRELRARFADPRGGAVVQVADRDSLDPRSVADRSAWNTLLFGNMYAAAGVPSLVSYTGIGYRDMHEQLCLSYNGSVCPRAYSRLWARGERGVPLVDQVKADRVVVQRKLVDVRTPPPGWSVARADQHVVVLERAGSVPWKRGRLSVARGVHIADDREADHRHEVVRFSGSRGGEVLFARLAWPGYRATVDGIRVPVARTASGLLLVRLPAGVSSGTLRISWLPRGFECAAVLALLIASVVLVWALVERFCWREVARC